MAEHKKGADDFKDHLLEQKLSLIQKMADDRDDEVQERIRQAVEEFRERVAQMLEEREQEYWHEDADLDVSLGTAAKAIRKMEVPRAGDL